MSMFVCMNVVNGGRTLYTALMIFVVMKSEVDALQQLCLRAGIGQKDINTCSPNKSKSLFLLLTL